MNWRVVSLRETVWSYRYAIPCMFKVCALK
jgi:hypothetical protein